MEHSIFRNVCVKQNKAADILQKEFEKWQKQ